MIERLLLKRIAHVDHLYGLLLTFGLALIIQGLFRNGYGSSGLPYQIPAELRDAVEDVVLNRTPEGTDATTPSSGGSSTSVATDATGATNPTGDAGEAAGHTPTRCFLFPASCSWRAARTEARSDTSGVPHSHQEPLPSVQSVGWMSMWITVVRSAALARRNASSSSRCQGVSCG